MLLSPLLSVHSTFCQSDGWVLLEDGKFSPCYSESISLGINCLILVVALYRYSALHLDPKGSFERTSRWKLTFLAAALIAVCHPILFILDFALLDQVYIVDIASRAISFLSWTAISLVLRAENVRGRTVGSSIRLCFSIGGLDAILMMMTRHSPSSSALPYIPIFLFHAVLVVMAILQQEPPPELADDYLLFNQFSDHPLLEGGLGGINASGSSYRKESAYRYSPPSLSTSKSKKNEIDDDMDAKWSMLIQHSGETPATPHEIDSPQSPDMFPASSSARSLSPIPHRSSFRDHQASKLKQAKRGEDEDFPSASYADAPGSLETGNSEMGSSNTTPFASPRRGRAVSYSSAIPDDGGIIVTVPEVSFPVNETTKRVQLVYRLHVVDELKVEVDVERTWWEMEDLHHRLQKHAHQDKLGMKLILPRLPRLRLRSNDKDVVRTKREAEKFCNALLRTSIATNDDVRAFFGLPSYEEDVMAHVEEEERFTTGGSMQPVDILESHFREDEQKQSSNISTSWGPVPSLQQAQRPSFAALVESEDPSGKKKCSSCGCVDVANHVRVSIPSWSHSNAVDMASSSVGQGDMSVLGDDDGVESEDVAPVSSSVSKGEKESLYVMYELNLCVNGRLIVVKKRFRNFFSLHEELERTYPKACLPDPPKKRMMLNQRDIRQVGERKRKLEEYIKSLMQSNFRHSAELCDFFGISMAEMGIHEWSDRYELTVPEVKESTDDVSNDSVTQYHVCTYDKVADVEYHSYHRYSEFKHLHELLKKEVCRDGLERFPGKLTTGNKEKVNAKRRERFEAYLQVALHTRGYSNPLRVFLRLEEPSVESQLSKTLSPSPAIVEPSS